MIVTSYFCIFTVQTNRRTAALSKCMGRNIKINNTSLKVKLHTIVTNKVAN